MNKTKDLTPQRVRFEPQRRTLTVVRVKHMTPRLLRVTLSGDELRGFTSLGYDDHIKLFFPEPGLALPEMSSLIRGEGPKPPMRDYTPRRYDADRNELDIEFVLHGDGPAATWAAQAAVGQTLTIGGPRGSMVVPTEFDWFLLVGDETALPAIGRRLEELPAGKKVIALIHTASDEGELKLETRADADIRWFRQTMGEDALLEALGKLALPTGEGFAWAAGEYDMVRAVRAQLLDQHGIDKSRMRVVSYWRHGTADGKHSFED